MKIAVDNSDYSSVLDAVRPLVIERKLNAPSTCRLGLSLPSGGALAVPLRNQSLAVTGDDGTLYFTGYLAVSPLPEFAGVGMTGPVYRVALEAVSDEILLDSQLVLPSAGSAGSSIGQVLEDLVSRTGSSALRTSGLNLSVPVSRFVPGPGAKWSVAAGQAAGQARTAYRAVNGAISLAQVGAAVHALDEADGTLELGSLSMTASVERALANDVTVCGAEEPVAYVTEYFLGDGGTLTFPLSELPYFGPAKDEKIIWELFQEQAIDLRNWTYSAREGYFSITSDGLTMNGGTGVDGQVALVWIDQIEAGGTLLLEAVGVSLALGSTGTVAAVFSGIIESANCVAGFAVTSAQGSGVVSVAPLVQGVVAGPSYALAAGSQYTFRMRLHCPEVERISQWYRSAGDAGVVAFGGGPVVAQGRIQMEVQPFVDGAAGMPVVLYDGAVGYLPSTYTVAAASSVNLIGSIRSLFLKGLGSGWVSSLPSSLASGGSFTGWQTRRLGTAADGAECHLTRTGSLTFYTGNAPALGEMIAVNYRTIGRAVGRAVDADSQAELAAADAPATAVWIGTVTEPAGRSSLDCRNAAMALVTAASSVSAAWSGTYRTSNVVLNSGANSGSGGDVWPGDALLLTAPSFPASGGGGLAAQVVVRSATLSYAASSPDVVQYSIAFSNDWADDLAIKTSKTVPADAWLPAPVSPTYLANLNALTVTGISATAVSVAANVTPPEGGGFEVRRRDFVFQPGQDVDLVIRSAVPNFDIPRATEADRFYVRMYDGGNNGSGMPNYSEFSVGLFVNLPLSA